jgi:hypothetical protein
MHFLNCIIYITYRLDVLADGDYRILADPEVEISEDPGNIVGELTEAPNLSLEEFVNVSDPSLASEGRPRT